MSIHNKQPSRRPRSRGLKRIYIHTATFKPEHLRMIERYQREFHLSRSAVFRLLIDTYLGDPVLRAEVDRELTKKYGPPKHLTNPHEKSKPNRLVRRRRPHPAPRRTRTR